MAQVSPVDIYRVAQEGERVRFAVYTGTSDLAEVEAFYNAQSRGYFRFIAQRREA